MESKEKTNLLERASTENSSELGSTFRKALESALLVGIAALDLEGRQTYVNPGFCKMVGWSEEELLGATPPFVYWPPEEHERISRTFQEVLKGSAPSEGLQLRFRRKNGERFEAFLLVSPMKNSRGEVIGWISSVGDISGRKESERRARLNNSLFFEVFAKKNTRKEYLDAVVELIRPWSGCRCVGVRILDEEGFIPYESYLGFSHEFWVSENQLSVQHDQCACTRVIGGRPDPQDAPVISPDGSFYCNNTREFVEELGEKERARFRGMCIKSGFLSVAVIPIRYRDRVLGAIHLADERQGRVPLARVEFLESMARLVGEALNRFNLEEELQRNHEFEKVMSSLLALSLQDISQEELLERTISLITSPRWLALESKGCIFLVEEDPEVLVMRSQSGLPEAVRQACRRVPFGTCLCGQAASTREIQFADCFDQRHSICYEGMTPHSHYCLPLVSAGRVVGVINLYPKEGYGKTRKVEHSLHVLANVLVSIIERQEAERQLHTYQERLRSLASELSLTEERERRRLASDLHDSIAQVLAITKLKLQILRAAERSEGEAKEVDELCELIGQAIHQTRSLMFDLSPATLFESGLQAALAGLVERMRQLHGIGLELACEGGDGELTEEIRILLYRAVRELLINIVKHARAEKARITVSRAGGQIRIDVEDDGVGFEVSKVGTHKGDGFGLFSISERLHHLGGVLELHSEPGQGTRVTLLAPLQEGITSP